MNLSLSLSLPLSLSLVFSFALSLKFESEEARQRLRDFFENCIDSEEACECRVGSSLSSSSSLSLSLKKLDIFYVFDCCVFSYIYVARIMVLALVGFVYLSCFQGAIFEQQ